MHWQGDNFDHKIPAWVKSLGGWMRDVVDFCYPGICPACRQVCPSDAYLCTACDSQIQELARTPACFLCGLTLAYPDAPCPNCLGHGVPHYERVMRLGKFDEPLRTMIHQLKYQRAWIVGEILADLMLTQDHIESLLVEADCLMAVPLHGMAQFVRGYNQATIIAERISKATKLPVVRPVWRIVNTETQTHLSAAQRLANLRGAFELRDAGQIEGRRVVVIDDVKTTGATLRMLGQILRPAKPASLSALVVAVTESKGMSPR